MTVIQIAIILFVIFALSRAVLQFKHRTLTVKRLILWFCFWIIVGTVALSPQTTDVMAKLVGVGRGSDFVIYISLIIIFYLIFRVFVKIENTEREITKLVRKLAIEETNEDDK